MKKSINIKLIALPAVLIVSLWANDAAYNRGERLYFANGCTSCHGPEGEGSTTFPKLANQNKAYLIKKLQDFRAGKASSASQEMMAQFAQNLSDAQMNDLATFLSEHKSKETPDVSNDLLGVDF